MVLLLRATLLCSFIFFFNDTATTEIYTLSLHDALPISPPCSRRSRSSSRAGCRRAWIGPCRSDCRTGASSRSRDRKSTRLNSSHVRISYAVFCLKKKKHASIIESHAEHAYDNDPQVSPV